MTASPSAVTPLIVYVPGPRIHETESLHVTAVSTTVRSLYVTATVPGSTTASPSVTVTLGDSIE